jgi:hypothetical protein
MSRLVVAGAWTIEANHASRDIVGSQPVSTRLAYLQDVLRFFDGFCQTVSSWKIYSEGVLYIFVAPEYYFKSNNLNVERSLTKDERNTIIDTRIRREFHCFRSKVAENPAFVPPMFAAVDRCSQT